MAKRRISAKERERIKEILYRLDNYYSTEIKCYLNHENAWQLLIATILSAQCTDERVNMVTKELFVKYPDIEALAAADINELQEDIHSVGFYSTKAKNIKACATRLINEFGGEVPSDINDLIKLEGVGRKTANVIRGNIFNEPSIVVDTHVRRVSQKLGLTREDNPEKIEYDLMEVLPEEHWIRYNIQIIAHGRAICSARSPKCEECFLADLCKSGENACVN